jgi:uncharacterized paraquat-inducible protein A
VKDDPFRTLSEDDVRKITHGGISRALPIVKLIDLFRGRSGYVACPHCRELRHPEATVCPHCQRAINDAAGAQ